MSMNASIRLGAAALASTMLMASTGAAGGGGSEVFVLDFEEFAEGTELSTQYASFGVTFEIPGQSTFPIVSREGAPRTAFGGAGVDSPMSSGSGGLTDPVIGGDELAPNDIRINFDPPVLSASFYVIDIDGSESVTATAFDGDTPIDSQTVDGSTEGAGNGKSKLIGFAARAITSIVLDISGPATNTGWAIDFLTISRPCPVPGCSLRLRIAQESAPGVGDFAAHQLGELVVWGASSTTPEVFYGYGVPEGSSWNGAALQPIVDRSHILGAVTNEGITLFMVHDRAIPNDPDGGVAETSLEVFGDQDGCDYAVQDDPPPTKASQYIAGGPGETLFQARHVWSPCCTDGYAVSGIDCSATVILQFADVDGVSTNATIDGLSSWVAYGADGETIPLALQVDRRVRIDVLPPGNCRADFNCDGVVNGADISILLGSWSNTGGAPDIDGSGLVDGADLSVLLGDWGGCQ